MKKDTMVSEFFTDINADFILIEGIRIVGKKRITTQ